MWVKESVSLSKYLMTISNLLVVWLPKIGEWLGITWYDDVEFYMEGIDLVSSPWLLLYSNKFPSADEKVWFWKLQLLFKCMDDMFDNTFQLVFVQKYVSSNSLYTDGFSCDTRLSLPKIVSIKHFSIIPAASVICPVHIIPDFELVEPNHPREWFVRYDITESSILEKMQND